MASIPAPPSMVREILERDLVSEVQKSSLMQRAVLAWRQMRGAA
jgi:hypothetical protein